MKNMKNKKITKEVIIKIVDFIFKEYYYDEFPTRNPGLWLGEKVNIFLNIMSFDKSQKVYNFSEAGKKWLDLIYENEDEVIKKIKNKCICNKNISEVTEMADELCEYIQNYKKEIEEIISKISKNENIPIAHTEFGDGEFLNTSFALNVELDLLNSVLITKILTSEVEMIVDEYEFKDEEEIVDFFNYISFDDLVYVEESYIEKYEKEIEMQAISRKIKKLNSNETVIFSLGKNKDLILKVKKNPYADLYSFSLNGNEIHRGLFFSFIDGFLEEIYEKNII